MKLILLVCSDNKLRENSRDLLQATGSSSSSPLEISFHIRWLRSRIPACCGARWVRYFSSRCRGAAHRSVDPTTIDDERYGVCRLLR
jgi:hypothetical protein